MRSDQSDDLSVLHVAQPEEAGVPRAVASLITDQLARGWKVHIAAPARGEWLRWVAAADVRHHVWAATRAPGPTLVPEMRRLHNIIAEVKPDLIHLHSSKAGLAGRLTTRGSIPTIFQPHGWSWLAAPKGLTAGIREWERFAMRWTDAVICVSDRESSLGVAARLHGDLRAIPNGVDTHLAAPAPWDGRGLARKTLGLEDAPTAICVGRLHHAKGQDTLVRAWPLVLRAVPRARLYLLGRGPEKTALVDLAGPGVSFASHRDDVPSWLAAADVVVVPSRWEGMSLAMLEAMAAARSVVTTDVPGAHEAVGKTAGTIVPVDDLPALADAVVRRLTDPELARREGMAARARAERAFDLRKTTAEVAALYREIVQRAT